MPMIHTSTNTAVPNDCGRPRMNAGTALAMEPKIGMRLKTIATIEKNGVLSKAFYTPEHLGTHLDAPNHFEKNQPSVDEIKPTRWGALAVLAAWLALAVSWTAHIDRVTSADGARSSIDWAFLVPCALVAALIGAVQAGPKARWWGAILVVATVLTIICMLATFFGTPRDWWHARS